MRKFKDVTIGYDKTEVNEFVSQVTIEYENMLKKLKSRDREIAQLQEKIAHYKNLETTLNKAIIIAEESSNQLKRAARDEAKAIISDAKKNASHIINDALLQAEKTELEADQLRRSLKIYKSRIKHAIEEQLTMVDDVDNIPEN